MDRGEFTVNEDFGRKTSEFSGSSGKYTQRPTDERCSYSTKLHLFVKDDNFTSTSADSDDVTASRSQSCCGLLCLSLALVACAFGCYVMWGTNFFTLLVHQNLVISNNSMRYEAWKSPPVHAFLRVYIFNFTNVEEFENGTDSKLKVKELGPYTYIEKLERVDVRFNKNGTATYRDKKTYKFSPPHSQGTESDVILVPNLPFLAVMSFTAEISSLLRWSFHSILNSMGGGPFISLKVGDFLWGYEDRFSFLAQNWLSFRYDLPFKKFGILSAKNQTQKDLVTIYTGEDDPSKTGIVAIYNGKTSLDYWNSKECNRIDGTDGTVYPPPLVHPNSTLYIYLKDLCRKMPLVYNKQYLDKHGIPVLRFHMPKSVFASGQEHKDNLCYCSQSRYGLKCLPSGIFNVGPCAYEAPIVTSLPHFLYGDPVLYKRIEGLQPKVNKHESYVEVDPKMGIPVGGKSRLQLNVLLNGEFGTPTKNRIYKDQLVFPITWMDYIFPWTEPSSLRVTFAKLGTSWSFPQPEAYCEPEQINQMPKAEWPNGKYFSPKIPVFIGSVLLTKNIPFTKYQGIDRLPDDISATIRSLLSFIKVAEFVLSYGFVISVFVLSLFFATSCRQVWKRKIAESVGETPLVIVHEKR